VEELSGLFLQGRNNPGMAMTETVDRHAGQKIEIGLSVHIPETAAPSLSWNDGITAVVFENDFVRP
jgi:hypothetical protein